MKKYAIRLLSGIGMGLAFACAAQAGPAITKISAASISGTEQALEVTFDGPVPTPASFSLSNPPRITFDFSGASVRLSNPVQNLGNPLIKSATAIEANGRARLVLNLSQNAAYTSQVSGNKFDVRLSSEPGAIRSGTPSTPPVTLAPTTTPTSAAIPAVVRNETSIEPVALDFRRGSNGEARVEITLPNANTPVDVKRERGNIVVSLPGQPLPRNQQRKLDVTDFDTAVKRVDAANQGRNGHIVIEPRGSWDYTSYQTDRKLVVEVRKVEEGKAKTAASPPVYKGEKLSLDFQNIDVRTVLQVIADFTGLNIIASDTVTGSITLRLKDVPWDQALDLIMQAKGLDQRRVGNVVQIAPREELLDRDKKTLEAQKQLETLEPLRSETFLLKYRSTDDFKPILDTDSGSGTTAHRQTILSERGSVLFDPKTNTLIVNDTPSVIEKVRALVEQLDKAQRQVLIEARIVEANDNFARDLGVKLGIGAAGRQTGIADTFNAANTNLGNNVTNYVAQLNSVAAYNQAYQTYLGQVDAFNFQQQNFTRQQADFLAGRSATAPTPPTAPIAPLRTFMAGPIIGLGPNINLPAAGGSSTIAIVSRVAGGLLGLEISAMQAESKGKIISSPRVLTADGTEATIQQGTQIPYQSATSSGATAVSFINAVLSLKVKPQITPDGNIIMTVAVNKDSPSPTLTVNGTPAINTTLIQTQTMVENGGTVVIGGIYLQDEAETVNKVPLLGDIPILGNLFKERGKHNKRSELLVFLTPRLVDNLSSFSTR